MKLFYKMIYIHDFIWYILNVIVILYGYNPIVDVPYFPKLGSVLVLFGSKLLGELLLYTFKNL